MLSFGLSLPGQQLRGSDLKQKLPAATLCKRSESFDLRRAGFGLHCQGPRRATDTNAILKSFVQRLTADEEEEQRDKASGNGTLKDTGRRTLAIALNLGSPDKILAQVNAGDLQLIDEAGVQSDSVRFGNLELALPKALRPGVAGLRAKVKVPAGFGKTGAVKIRDSSLKSDDRFWLLRIEVTDDSNDVQVTALAESWVHVKQGWRTIFVNKAYLPSETPAGLVPLREAELEALSMDDHQERQPYDRIYDYDVYSDLGTQESPRPALGGSEFPYPRRERTGRPLYNDGSERPPPEVGASQSFDLFDKSKLAKALGKLLRKDYYIPADEEFSPEKKRTFLKNALFDAIPSIVAKLSDRFRKDYGLVKGMSDSFISIPAIARFYNSNLWNVADFLKTLGLGGLDLRAPTPLVFDGRTTAWDSDQELGRQTLSGQNPCVLQALTALPADSAITAEHLQPSVELNNVQDLLSSGRRLFQIDYTALTGFVAKANAQTDKNGKQKFYMYASRAIFYLTNNGFMRPVAIELIDVPDASQPNATVKTVHTPNEDTHLWRLAKAYFSSNDSGWHQLISHWLRTHACTEPYIIAARRRLSALHPVFALIHPHFKYTMAINRNARQKLINAGGVIESAFSPGEYAMRISSVVYGQLWEFDKEALPADLIARGMAVEDPQGSISWKGKQYACVLKDYPYAEDGMLIWDAIRKWMSDYLKIYYKDDQTMIQDTEIMGWWREVQEKGHEDKTSGWPALNTVDDLTDILTSIAWICSGHHAAVNFGQYDYSAYMPNHPSATHKPMPDPSDAKAWAEFKRNPDGVYLDIVSTQPEALTVMVIVQLLSTHDPEEEYLGERTDGWTSNPAVLSALATFRESLQSIQSAIVARNQDISRKSRCPDYNLLAPFTNDDQIEDIRGQGIPNSISI